VLKDESRGSSSLRIGKFSRGLVIAELALSGGLLVGAGFMIQSVVQLARFEYGVPTNNVFTARVGLFDATYPDSASRARFWTTLEEKLQGIPGQRGVALMTVLPGLEGWNENFALEGKTYASERDYPSTRPGRGHAGMVRDLQGEADRRAPAHPGRYRWHLPVAVVSRGFVHKHLGDESALGRRIRIGQADSKEPWLTIVGVVPDVWYDGTDDDDQLGTVVFTPLGQSDYRFVSLAVVAPGDPTSLANPVQGVVSSIDPDQPIYFVRTLQEAIRRTGGSTGCSVRSSWCSAVPRSCWRPSGCTVLSVSLYPGEPGRSEFAWRSAPARAMCCGCSFVREDCRS
jgi:hypothetical protein